MSIKDFGLESNVHDSRERDKNAFRFKFGNFNIHGFCCYKHEVFLIVYIIVMKIPSSVLKMMCRLL